MESETTKVEQPTAISVGAKFGLYLGLVSIAMTIIYVLVGMNPFDGGWKGWVGAIVALAFVVLAHKNFKDTGNGYMSYGQGLGIAVVLSIVSTLVGALFSFIYISFIDPAMFEQVWEKAAEQMESQGQSQEAIDMGLSWGRKLFWPMYLFFGIFFGFLIGLVVSIFTQKKAPDHNY